MTAANGRQAVELKDYKAPDYRCSLVELDFRLDPAATIVRARQHLERQGSADAPLVLHGEAMELLEIAIDGTPLDPGAYTLGEETLVLHHPPARFVLEIASRISPEANTALEGLYISSGIFCTQCEAEGFRRITWFQDRPDVMARYRVRIEADKKRYPVLLSNGNLRETGDAADGRHFAQWEDPFPKPSYLFALVAGDLGLLKDRFVTRSGREVTLCIYSEHENIGKCGHAMESLKKSMAWDEEVFGLEYDLDLFQIVAVSDFNMGAMENKGLNIFNTSATLADPATATDADFLQVERIIAHEYFHNWTGNRVTCRDWFQLTLKEGLTVFRDQQFTADMHSAAVKRIADVALLRESQFNEDSGPLAHPIRPSAYIEINNFYTRTVYEKGAEVVRMIHTLIGPEAFRRGMDLYFERHDGQAVTCEDFVAAMGDAAGRDMDQFMRWYGRAGTPMVKAERVFDADAGTLALTLTQIAPAAADGDDSPLLIPVRMGLVGRTSGQPLPLRLRGENDPGEPERVLELREKKQVFVFEELEEEPVVSLLRGFSAPVKLDLELSRDDLAFLLANDVDAFNRWEAGQRLALEIMHEALDAARAGRDLVFDDRLAAAFGRVLDDWQSDPAFVARAVSLPSRNYVAQDLPSIDVDAVDAVHKGLRAELGRILAPQWRAIYDSLADDGPFSLSSDAMARRSLKNVALAYLVEGGHAEAPSLALAQYRAADNMTDEIAALRLVAEHDVENGQGALDRFYERWQHEPLVVNKWFAIQAALEDGQSLERVLRLMRHPAFRLTNPNRVRSLIGVFSMLNMTGFHRKDGKGYRFLADMVVELDRRNPQIAARLLSPLGRWRRYDEGRQAAMKAALQQVMAAQGLSRDCFEIASKSLGEAG